MISYDNIWEWQMWHTVPLLLLGRASPGRRRSCGSVSWRASTRRCSERTPFCRRRRDRWTPRGTAGWGRAPTDACLTAPHGTFWRILFFPIFILNLYQITPMFKSSWIELQDLFRISFSHTEIPLSCQSQPALSQAWPKIPASENSLSKFVIDLKFKRSRYSPCFCVHMP